MDLLLPNVGIVILQHACTPEFLVSLWPRERRIKGSVCLLDDLLAVLIFSGEKRKFSILSEFRETIDLKEKLLVVLWCMF